MAPPDPFGILRDLADGTEHLARSVIGQERIRLAVTGLTRAGKTVFVTSLVANLLAAGRGRRTLPALETAAGGRLRAVRLVPAGVESMPRFDVHGHLSALARDPPAWPGRTEDLSGLELTLELDRSGMLGLGGLLGPRTVTLDLVDYPGEWLLDLPMLDQDYAAWSAETLARLRRPARLPATAAFLAFLDGLPEEAPGEEALARHGYGLYREALRACRDRLGFRFLQPGRVLNPGPRGEAPILWFFPLDEARQRGGLGALLRRRHAAYVEEQRDRFFDPFFRRFQRQAVLVDVLGALHAGRDAFDDTAEALSAIAAALRAQEGWLARLLGLGAARVAFVATKADHVPASQRPALVSLLGHLVQAPQGVAAGTGVHALAAIRCTEDAVAQGLDGRPVPAVRGYLLDQAGPVLFDAGEVPATPPDPGFWQDDYFEVPPFRPPRLDPGSGAGVPHLGLDGLLAWLIGDLL